RRGAVRGDVGLAPVRGPPTGPAALRRPAEPTTSPARPDPSALDRTPSGPVRRQRTTGSAGGSGCFSTFWSMVEEAGVSYGQKHETTSRHRPRLYGSRPCFRAVLPRIR